MSSSAKTAIIAAALGTAAAVSASTPAAAAEIQKPTVVLVHGAFADGSTWNQVIPLLEEKGLKVVAVQNPLSSLADDVAATRRVLDRQTGPVVLVGHSWGGVAVTEAGAPSEGQSVVDVSKDYLLAEKRELVEQVASTGSWAAKELLGFKIEDEFPRMKDEQLADRFFLGDVDTLRAIRRGYSGF
jgi:pimeloyl-ACP methyl ester carboxylesterase